MGIRSNVGNVATNAIQTLAISGTTASKVFGKNKDKKQSNRKPSIGSADTTLNNPSIDEILKPTDNKGGQEVNKPIDVVDKPTNVIDKPTDVVDKPTNEIVENTEKPFSDVAPNTQEGREANRRISFDLDYFANEEKIQELIDKGEM